MNKKKFFFLGLAIVIVVVGFSFLLRYFLTQNKENSQPESKNWVATTTVEDVVFNYPPILSTSYISAVEWPPQVKILKQKFSCVSSGNEILAGGKTESRIINNRTYCVTQVSEGAAGSVYTSYTYALPKDDKTIVLTFTLRFVQCQNYDELKASECETERAIFEVDKIADEIAQTVEKK